MLILNYSNKESTVMTYPILLGMKMSDLIITMRRKNPGIPSKPLIDYDLAWILQQNVLLGATLGVIVNLTLPNLVITIAFILFLSYSFTKAYGNIKRIMAEVKRESAKDGDSGDKPD